MRTSAPGNSARRALRAAGFTLVELLVVLAIVAIASAGVVFALRDGSEASLDREAQRLSALLESARARSRLSGQAVRWVADPQGFHFEGLPRDALPHEWLQPDTQVVGGRVLLLGPDPVIGPQSVVLASANHPEHEVRIATDGLRPFAVSTGQP